MKTVTQDESANPSEIVAYCAKHDLHQNGVNYFNQHWNDAAALGIAELYEDIEAWGDAVPYYARFVEAYRSHGTPELLRHFLAKLALAHAWMANSEAAIECGRESVSLCESKSLEGASVSCTLLDARVALLLAEWVRNRCLDDTAVEQLESAIERVEYKDPRHQEKLYRQIGCICRFANKEEVAKRLEVRARQLNSDDRPDASGELERLLSGYAGDISQNSVWEMRYFGRLESTRTTYGIESVEFAQRLARYVGLCARHDGTAAPQRDGDFFRSKLVSFRETLFPPEIAAQFDWIVEILIHLLTNRPNQARHKLSQRLVIESNSISSVMGGRPEEELLEIIKLFHPTLDLYMSLIDKHFSSDRAAVKVAYTNVIRRKGLVYVSAAIRSKYWRSLGSTDEKPLFDGRDYWGTSSDDKPILDKWKSVCNVLLVQAFHHLIGPRGSVQMQGFEDNWGDTIMPAHSKPQKRGFIESMMFLLKASNNQKVFARKAELEEELCRAYPVTQLVEEIHFVGFSEVSQALEVDSALIEYVKIRGYPLDSNDWCTTAESAVLDVYYAFIIFGNREREPRLVRIGIADEIDTQIETFRNATLGSLESVTPIYVLAARDQNYKRVVADPNDELAQSSGMLLREVVLDLLIDKEENISRLYFATDGNINELPFHCLPLGNGAFIIDKYEIVYLNSGRDLLRNTEDPEVLTSKSLVVADPDFDLFNSRTENDERSKELELHRKAVRSANLTFPRLPGTRLEGEVAARHLGADLLLGAEALAGRVKERESPDVLHIATHGFFIPYTPRPVSTEDGDEDDVNKKVAMLKTGIENPLIRSGLALAGANSWLYGRELPDDAGIGFLTAQELAAMDLRGTRLVILSACESGLGDVTVGQGVLGLRHAVMVAGAQALIMSMWRVPDKATQLLMAEFYRNWSEDIHPAIALQKAQQKIREEYPSVRHWGGFIYLGTAQLRREETAKSETIDAAKPALMSGLNALRALATVEFSELLDEAGMELSPPPGFHSIEIREGVNVPYHFALKSELGDVEIRYSVVPFFGRHRAAFSVVDYHHLVFTVSGGQSVQPSPFPEEGVRKEFGGDLGLTTGIRTSEKFCSEYAMGAVVYVRNESRGAGLMCFLFNDFSAVLPIMQSRHFSSLHFREL